MSEHIGDVLEAGAAIGHLGRRGVPKEVGADPPRQRYAGAGQTALDEAGDRRGTSKRLRGGGGLQKNPSALGGRSVVTQVIRQRRANLLGQRQNPFPAPL